ncbi:hypothetical protein [Microbacterium deminutum]|uniref:Yip1 domain-containing protein n=1 Tax=Microbacterium deminutum TaxID=344164 RepID=A0ABP5C8L6_9MICO
MSDPADPRPAVPPPIPRRPPAQRHPAPPSPAQPWAAPAAPPFGVPSGDTQHPRYAPPPGYSAAGAPSAGVAVTAPPRPAPRGFGLGLVALIVAIVAAVIPAILVSIATFEIGLGAGHELAMRPIDAGFEWSVLTPVRGWVLLAEVSFWVGTILGVWAIAQGLVAIVRNRGRGLAIAAVVVAVVGAIGYAVALQGFLTAGLAAGTSVGG